MKIKTIVAMDATRGIGKDGGIPWYNAYDLARFKLLTYEHIVIMGRKTWKSLGKYNRPLKNRDNYIVSSNAANVFNQSVCAASIDWQIKVFSSPMEALEQAKEKAQKSNQDIWIIGGQSIYTDLLPYSEELYITQFRDKIFNCDTFFPEYRTMFDLAQSESHSEEEIDFKLYRVKELS